MYRCPRVLLAWAGGRECRVVWLSRTDGLTMREGRGGTQTRRQNVGAILPVFDGQIGCDPGDTD